jgi:hypothetical protein
MDLGHGRPPPCAARPTQVSFLHLCSISAAKEDVWLRVRVGVEMGEEGVCVCHGEGDFEDTAFRRFRRPARPSPVR